MERENAITISLQTPLLQTTQNRQQPQQGQQQQQFNGIDEDDHHDTHLDKTLQRLDFFLCFLGFHQTSIISFGLSWAALLLVGIAIPVVILELSSCSGCEEYQVRNFEFIVLASQASLGAVSLLCLSHNLRKYGIRKFLFVDRFSGQMVRFMDQYIQKIRDTYRMLMLWLLPCLVLKTARETIRLLNVKDEPWWQSAAIALALIISWMYMNAICLVACIMFHLEHFRLRQYLSKISHRFRIYLLLVFLVVTASQFVTLLETTGYSGTITFLNGGDFAVTSVVQVVGITLCLHAATKISHRAQGIASVASKWHALATCNSPYSGGAQSRRTNSSGSLDTTNHYHSLSTNYSESDLESLDWTSLPSNMQLPSFASSYHKRQSFDKSGGITIFGWTVDRALICTIFFIELSLVLFVLGNTVSIPSGAIPPS